MKQNKRKKTKSKAKTQHDYVLAMVGYVLLPNPVAVFHNMQTIWNLNINDDDGGIGIRVRFSFPIPFIPLFSLPSLQSLHHLSINNLSLRQFTCIAPILPATLLTLQVTFAAMSEWETLQSDLPDRLQHCHHLRHLIFIHPTCQRNYDPHTTTSVGLDERTSLRSLHVLQELEQRLAELEQIQWHVPIDPVGLARQYEEQCQGNADVYVPHLILLFRSPRPHPLSLPLPLPLSVLLLVFVSFVHSYSLAPATSTYRPARHMRGQRQSGSGEHPPSCHGLVTASLTSDWACGTQSTRVWMMH